MTTLERMKSPKRPPNPAHVKGVPKGEERVQKKGPEPGRHGSIGNPPGGSPGQGPSRVAPVQSLDPNSPTLLTS